MISNGFGPDQTRMANKNSAAGDTVARGEKSGQSGESAADGATADDTEAPKIRRRDPSTDTSADHASEEKQANAAGKAEQGASAAPARGQGAQQQQTQAPRKQAPQNRQGQKTPQQGKQPNKGNTAKPGNQQGGAGATAEAPEVKPVAGPATMKRRHWGVIVSFLLLVVVPWLAAAAYLFFVAEDQYHSTAGFTVRSQEQAGATELLSGLAGFASGSTASDSDILYEFIQSQEMVRSVDDEIDLRAHYSRYWPSDWAFSIWPDASQEELIWYWNRMVGVSYDSNTGLIEVQVRAFDADTAQDINEAVVAESQARINALNRQAREDAMRYAQADLEEAVEGLKTARQELTEFRTRTQIVDPETDIQTRTGVMSSLQQQLASALVEYDLLQRTSGENDPRLRETRQRIEVIRERIATERRNFATSSTDTGGVSQDYPSLIADFERLKVDLEYAEESYFAALKALEAARDEADRQSRYLATYITPTRADESKFPQRFVLAGLILLFMVLTWSIGVLIYYSIRDRS